MSAVAAAGELQGPEPAEGDERSFAELLAILRRRAFLVAAVALTVVVMALIYVLTAPRFYSASSVVLLEPRSSLSQSDGMRYSFASDSALVDSQIKLLTSETVLRRAVDRERLQEDPEFGAPTGGLWWSIRRLIGWGRNESEEAVENTNATVEALAKATTVKRPERTYVMEVSVSSRDSKKAARLANAIAESYIADQADARSEISRREQDFLEGNITQLRRKIEKAENDVETFKGQNAIIGASGKLVNEQLLAEINTELSSARARAAEARSRYDQVRRIIASGRSVETLPEALKSPVIDKLRIQFAEIVRQEANAKITLGEMHPQSREIQQQLRDTRRLIGEELNRIAEGARTDLRIAESNETALAKQVEDLKREATTTNQSIVRLRELEREVDTNKAVLDNLLRAKGTVTRDSVDTPIARIIARAAPPLAPSSPRRIPIMLLAGVVGVGLGAAAAFAAEGAAGSRRRRAPVAPPQRTWTILQFPPKDGEDAPAPVADIREASYQSAIETVAAAIPPRGDAKHPATCLVVDCGAGEASARFAADLAHACAMGGRSTLLVEMSDEPSALARGFSRDLAVGAVAMPDGESRAAILAIKTETGRLVVAPAGGDAAGAGESFGRADDFDLVIGYAAHARAVRRPDEVAASAGLVTLVLEAGRRMSRIEQNFVERMTMAANGRCIAASAPPADA